MQSLIRETIEFLKEQTDRSVITTAEEHAYFFPKKETPMVKIDGMNDIRTIVTQFLPDVALTESIPDDAQAKKRAAGWQDSHAEAKVVVVSFGETGAALQFLHNVTHAINTLLVPAHLIDGGKIEKEKGWDTIFNNPQLQLILAPPFSHWKTASLARGYRENPSSHTHFIQNTPLVLFHPIASYLKNPDLKRELWKNLSLLLSTST